MANKHRNVLYIGVTANLKNRVWEHQNHEFSKSFTDNYNVEYLIYYELFHEIESAIAREKQLKKWRRSKKEHLIKLKNPGLIDLSEEVMEDIYSLLEG